MEHHVAPITAKERFVHNVHRHIKTETHDRIDYRGKVCQKPWGHEFLALETPKMGVWIMMIKRGGATSLHCHFNKDTVMIVLDGAAKVTLSDGQERCLSPMSSMYIPKYAFHGIGALSDACYVMEIEIYDTDAVSWSDKNDLLRLADQYKRTSRRYEDSIELSTDLEAFGAFSLDAAGETCYRDVRMRCTTWKSGDAIVVPPTAQHTLLTHGTLTDGRLVLREGSLLDTAMLPLQFADPVTTVSISRPRYAEDAKVVHGVEHLILLMQTTLKGRRVALTSGCFDIVHAGHIDLLKHAQDLADILVVCLSCDDQIRALKGPGRPVNTHDKRLALVKTLPCVDYVVLYEEVDNEREETLGHIMQIVNPEVWVKGTDYTEDDIRAKHPYLGRIDLMPLKSGYSTTNIIAAAVESAAAPPK